MSTFKVVDGRLVEAPGGETGAHFINWADPNIEIANTLGIDDVREVAKVRPAAACVDRENYHGRVGYPAGRVCEDAPVEAKQAKQAKADKAGK